jgi:hypothetical protein
MRIPTAVSRQASGKSASPAMAIVPAGGAASHAEPMATAAAYATIAIAVRTVSACEKSRGAAEGSRATSRLRMGFMPRWTAMPRKPVAVSART